MFLIYASMTNFIMVSCPEEIKRKVIQDLNTKYGRDLLDSKRCAELKDTLVEEKSRLLKKLNITNSESSLKEIIQTSEADIEKADDLVTQSKDLLSHIQTNLKDVNDARQTVRQYFDQLNILQCTHQYMRVIQYIEHLSEELQREVGKKDDEQCVTLFANLTEISRNLEDFSGVYLGNYLKETIHNWHNILKEKLARDFDEVLKAIKWPFVSSNFSLILPLSTHIQRLQILVEFLLQIEIPNESANPDTRPALLTDFPPLCLPVQLLVEPLKKRFLYHFYGARKTNRVDKPEWYFTQILTWIRDHRDFLSKYIQPVIDKLGLHHIDAKLEFYRGLIQMAVEKVYSELPNIQFDDLTFSHTVDESLSFDKELRETYDYPQSQPSILTVLTQGNIFSKWLAMEKKYATEKMDAMLPPNSVDAFELLTSDVEDLKITTCADSFITLLQTITERYEALPQPGHRLQFLELQLELLDDFRVRLLQLVNAEEGDIVESTVPSIANSIYYIENVLIDWGAMLHYLTLYYYKNQLETARQSSSFTSVDFLDEGMVAEFDTDTVFAETLSLYGHMRKDLLLTLVDTVIAEVKIKSRSYRQESWFRMKVSKDFRSLSLSPSSCPMFEVLSKRLHQLEQKLHAKMFTYVWRSVAQQMDAYLFEELILDNRFSEGGALQIKFDITRNLIPMFSQYSEKSSNYFSQCLEAINLLNISKGSAMLLRETLVTLEGATGVEDTRGKALKEIGVSKFTPKMAVKILNQRMDITPNRLAVD